MTTAWLRKAAVSLWFIVLVTVAARIAFSAYETYRFPSPGLERAAFDTEVGSIARSLASGKGFSSPYNRETGPTAILPPVYPLLAAGVFRLFGIQSVASFRVLLLFNIVCAALTCLAIWKTGEMIGGMPLAASASWMWALFPNGIIISFEWIWETSLSALLAATLLWLTLRLPQAPSRKRWARWRWAGYGLLWGITLMTNPALGVAMPVLLAWGTWRLPARAGSGRSGLSAWRNAVLALGVMLAVCVPWILRNYAVFHRFIPLRSGFGFELYIGNNENYAEPHVWPSRITYERELLRYVRMGEMPFMDEEKRKALAFIHAYPAVALRLCARRVVDFWTGTPSPVQSLRGAAPLFDRFVVLCNLLLPLAMLGGLIRLAVVRSPLLIPLAAFPALTPIVYYVSHTSLRYRHPIDPCVFLLAAAAFSPLGARRFSRQLEASDPISPAAR